MGGVATYNLFPQYPRTSRTYVWSYLLNLNGTQQQKKLTIHKDPRANEKVLMMVYMYRPDSELFKDYLAKKWIKDYTLAKCKFMLGSFSNSTLIAGPKVVRPLNGDTLKQEAQAEMDRLEAEVKIKLLVVKAIPS